MSMYRMLVNWDQNDGDVEPRSERSAACRPPRARRRACRPTPFCSMRRRARRRLTSRRRCSTGLRARPTTAGSSSRAATNGWDFNTSEAAPANRPALTVNYTAPSGAGQFHFLNLAPSKAEGDSGDSIAELQISRIGGSTGAVSVDYTIAAGGANPRDCGHGLSAPADPITVNFAAGQTVATVPSYDSRRRRPRRIGDAHRHVEQRHWRRDDQGIGRHGDAHHRRRRRADQRSPRQHFQQHRRRDQPRVHRAHRHAGRQPERLLLRRVRGRRGRRGRGGQRRR